MGRVFHKIVDTVVLIFCLPLYAVVVPLMMSYQFIVPRVRHVRIGHQQCRWQKPDVREELRVVDISRLDLGLVGVQRRIWNVLYHQIAPPFPESVEYCTLSEFWFGNSRLLR